MAEHKVWIGYERQSKRFSLWTDMFFTPPHSTHDHQTVGDALNAAACFKGSDGKPLFKDNDELKMLYTFDAQEALDGLPITRWKVLNDEWDAEDFIAGREAYETLRTAYAAHGVDGYPEWSQAIATVSRLKDIWCHFAQLYIPPKQLSVVERAAKAICSSMLEPCIAEINGRMGSFANPQEMYLSKPNPAVYHELFSALLQHIEGWSWSLDESDDGLTWRFELLERKG